MVTVTCQQNANLDLNSYEQATAPATATATPPATAAADAPATPATTATTATYYLRPTPDAIY